MKKKALALLLAAAMAIQPLSVAGAGEFTDGQLVDVEAEAVEEVAEEPVEVFTDDVAKEPVVTEEKAEEGSVAPSETAIQMGDDVWVEFDDATSTATISGTGDMWDYYENGYDITNKHKNPFTEQYDIKHVIIKNGITSVSSNLLYSYGYNIETVQLGEDIKEIGKSAFSGCNIAALELPEKLEKIGDGSFTSCGVKELVLPGNIVKFGTSCFEHCQNLEKVTMKEGILSIGESMFSGCRVLKTVIFPNSLEKIGSAAFSSTGVTAIDFPPNIKYLEQHAFSGCENLTSISLPSSLVSIGYSVFEGCRRITDIKFDEDFSHDIFGSMFKGCDNVTEVFIPNGVGRIWSEAFADCTSLKTITIPASVGEIYDNAFSGCTKLTIKGYRGSRVESFAKEKGIKFEEIGSVEDELELSYPFSHWQFREFYKITIGCRTNKRVSYYSTYVKKGENAPEYDSTRSDGIVEANRQIRIENFEVPEEVVDIYIFATDLENNTYKRIKISPDYSDRPEKPLVTTWPVQLGKNITATLENGVLNLTGTGSTYDKVWNDMDELWSEFFDKESLSKINKLVIGEGITRIGNGVFSDCVNLKEIVFPKSLKSMGEEAFRGCKSLKEFVIPEGVTEIGGGILCDCSLIEFVSFPSTLKLIPCFSSDYDGLPSLRRVSLSEGNEIFADGAFCWYPNLKSITIPSTVTQVGEYVFDYSGFVEFNWPSNIKKVSFRAFEGDALLKTVNIAEGVTSIEEDAFKDCSQLQSISIPKSVTEIHPGAFRGCPNFYIRGEKGSYAEQFAKDFKIPFRYADFKVTFKNKGKTVKTEFVDSGKDATPPELKMEGYTLSWDADYTNITEDMVINAIWTKNDSDKPEPPSGVYPPSETKYTVTFKDRGKVIKTEKVVSGEAADFPYVSRYGYELSWDKDFSKVTSNMTVNAVWTVIKPVKVTSMTAEVLPKYARLSWDETEFTSYYLVYRKAATDKEFKQVAKTTRGLWNDKKVKPGNEYQYKVAAVRSVEGKKYQGEYSDAVTAKIGKPETGDIYSVGKLNYKIMNSNEVRVTGLAKDTARLSIPTSVFIVGKSYKITSIDHKAFYRNANLIDVKIGNNVTYVGKYAFYQCPNLETVKFGGRVQTISTCAFTQCPKLGNVVLPSSVERLGAKAFFKCTSMRIMTVKTSRLNYLGTKAFAINPKITIRVPKSKYSAYIKMIKKSGRYAATKYQKF